MYVPEMKSDVVVAAISQSTDQCLPQLFDLSRVSKRSVVGTAPKPLNRRGKAIVGEAGVCVGELYHPTPAQDISEALEVGSLGDEETCWVERRKDWNRCNLDAYLP